MKKTLSILLALLMLLSALPAALAEADLVAVPQVTQPASVVAVNAVLQQADAKGKATGEKMTEMTFAEGDGEFVVTAVVPKGKKIDYWVINGVRYVFDKTPKSIHVKKLNYDCTFEPVFKKGQSSTLMSLEAIQNARTGDQLLLETINADFYFMKNATKGGNPAMRSFDFTNDYTNTVTKKQEQGGRITAKVKAKIPGSKKVDYWLFNQAEFHLSSNATSFVVHDLNASMTYEPVFAKAAQYFTVKCTGCTFSGGGFTNATSGKVKYGTKITVKTQFIHPDHWTRNGARWKTKKTIYDPYVGKIETEIDSQASSFTWTVKQNCNFVCISQIN